MHTNCTQRHGNPHGYWFLHPVHHGCYRQAAARQAAGGSGKDGGRRGALKGLDLGMHWVNGAAHGGRMTGRRGGERRHNKANRRAALAHPGLSTPVFGNFDFY